MAETTQGTGRGRYAETTRWGSRGEYPTTSRSLDGGKRWGRYADGARDHRLPAAGSPQNPIDVSGA